MAKENGLGMTISVDDSAGTARAIGNDALNISINMPSGIQDITGVNSTGMERLLLLADLSIVINGVFNDLASTGIFTVLKDYRTLAASQVGRTVTIVHSGQTLAEEILFSSFDLNRQADGSLLVSAPGSMSDGTLGGWA